MTGTIVNKGLVIETNGELAKVRTKRAEACGMCQARGFCHPFGEKENYVEVENTIGADVGQEVLLLMQSSSLVSASFVLYLVPLCCVVLGAVSGFHIGRHFGFVSPDAGLLLGVCAGLFASFWGNRRLAGRLRRSGSYDVRIAWPGDEQAACD
ncbi:SoxR reducing system RseC family protein [bacterium]|nr:SoxR reducing system RseC family protein [bacterium]